MCDIITGNAYNLLIYFGKETSFQEGLDRGQSETVFEYLLQSLGNGHHDFADRYYTMHSLISYLNAEKSYFTHTLMTNQKNFPPKIKQSKIKHLETKYITAVILVHYCVNGQESEKVGSSCIHPYHKGESGTANKRGKS